MTGEGLKSFWRYLRNCFLSLRLRLLLNLLPTFEDFKKLNQKYFKVQSFLIKLNKQLPIRAYCEITFIISERLFPNNNLDIILRISLCVFFSLYSNFRFYMDIINL